MELVSLKTGTSMAISAETVHVKRDKGVGLMTDGCGETETGSEVWRERVRGQTNGPHHSF